MTNIYSENSQDQQEFEQTNFDKTITIGQLIKEVWPLGFNSYGGPLAHIGLFRQKFVQKLKWIDQEKFVELTTICQSIPGPTSTQLLISISTLVSKRVFGGFVAFLLFFFPTFVIMTAAGMFLSDYKVEGIILTILNGFKCAAVAVVFQAFWGLSKKYREDQDSTILFCFCAFTYTIFPTINCMFVLFFVGIAYCSYFKQIEIKQSKNQPEPIKSILFGKLSIFLIVVLFFGLGAAQKYYPENIVLVEIAVFYRIGTLIIGGGHVILSMMYTEFQSYNLFSQANYWNGFSLVSCLPGPMFNISAYVGTLINGMTGAIISSIALFLPSFLSIWAIIPYWQTYRTNLRIQKIIYGLCCSSIGFILSSVYSLWIVACKTKTNQITYLNSLIAMLSYYLLQGTKWQIPYVILFGGVLFWIKEFLIEKFL